MKRPIFADYHSTTPVDPRVFDAMLPWFSVAFGNAASAHVYGVEAADVADKARADVAALLSAEPEEVIFTSGATESNNTALRGACEAAVGKDHLVVSPIEHSSVLAVADYLAGHGWKVTRLPIGASGVVDPEDVRRAITSRTALVSVMSANNEIGTVQPTREIGAVCKAAGVLFHCDACQGFGRVDLDVCPIGSPCVAVPDLVSISAHKLYGPKGIGALVVRKGTGIAPFMRGGDHEGGMRAGTPNTPGIVGLGMACYLMGEEWPAESVRLGAMRDGLLARMRSALGDGLVVNGAMGDGTVRLPQNLNVTLPGVCAERFDKAIRDHVAVSQGSACRAGNYSTSPVIRAIGGHEIGEGATVRVGLGRFTTEDEVKVLGDVLISVARSLREKGCAR